MVNSQNGWPVNPPRRARQVPGSLVKLVVADGPSGDLLLWFAGQFDRYVEDIDTATSGTPDDWGYAERPIRGGTDISNHASATAVDLNALIHPLGTVGTFTPTQRIVIRGLLMQAGGTIRWGGDYTGRKDEMHFEIIRDLPAVRAALARIAGEGDDMATLEEILYEVRRTNDILFEGGGVPGKTARGTLRDEVQRTNDMLFEGGNVPGETDPGSMKAQLTRVETMLTKLTGSATTYTRDAP